ncbi:MAG: alpha/beta hydrolase [Anaerolineae bacterium]|nr:alpha/beta hydrolase [Anaerolineae bacterium]
MVGQRKHNVRQLWRGLRLLWLLSLTVLVTWLGVTPRGQAVGRAGLLLLDILPQSPVSPLRTFTPPPLVESVSFPYEYGKAQGHLYRPAGDNPHSAMIMSLGYGQHLEDPLLVQVAEDLARLGIVVLIPDMPGIRTGMLVPEDSEVLVAAFEYLSSQAYVNAERVGFFGFCVGSSIALVAAEDIRINERVSYINVFGGYYDTWDFARAIAARSSRYNDKEFAWTPARQTILLFAKNVLTYLVAPHERQMFLELLQTPSEGPSAASSDLTTLGQVGYRLLTSPNPAAIDALMTQIPAQKLAEIDVLSPSIGIDRLKAKVFIMHDISDPYVPITESYRLADALSDPEQKVHAQFSLFDHVRPSHALSGWEFLREVVKLFLYLCKLMIHITA